jgi:hypothetical protein
LEEPNIFRASPPRLTIQWSFQSASDRQGAGGTRQHRDIRGRFERQRRPKTLLDAKAKDR